MASLTCFHILRAAWYAQPFNYLTANFSLVTGFILQSYSVCLCAFDTHRHTFLTTGIYSLTYWSIASSTLTSHSSGYVLEKPNAQTISLHPKYLNVGLPNIIVEGNWVKSKLSQTSQKVAVYLWHLDLWAKANCCALWGTYGRGNGEVWALGKDPSGDSDLCAWPTHAGTQGLAVFIAIAMAGSVYSQSCCIYGLIFKYLEKILNKSKSNVCIFG